MRAGLTAIIVTPAPTGARNGNRITALRWAKRLRELGSRVRLAQRWDGEPCDVLIAVHAVRSHASIRRHAEQCPSGRRIVALAGTDIYADGIAREAVESIELATGIVVLQPEAARRLPTRARAKVRVILQSASPSPAKLRLAPPAALEVVCLAHLREVKDPFLAAEAARLLPASSRTRVLHLGSAPDEGWRRRAEAAATTSNGRWSWLGGRPRSAALRILRGADVFLLTSINEGGANVVSEAIACGIPILSTKNDGAVGILGPDHPGYFPVGHATALAGLLDRCETDAAFVRELRIRSVSLQRLVDPSAERRAWSDLLTEVCR